MKLIDKDALVAEIEKRLYEYSSLKLYDACTEARASELGKLLVILNTLEVKEVDLDKEMNEALTHLTDKDMRGWFRYFFELGMAVSNKSQKGE